MDIQNVIGNLPLINEFPSRAYWEAGVWELIIERLSKVNNPADLKRIMRFLTSAGERRDIVYRALTGSRILTGIGVREIGRELWVARATISAIKKSLKEGEYKSSHARGHKPSERSKNLFPASAHRPKQQSPFRQRWYR